MSSPDRIHLCIEDNGANAVDQLAEASDLSKQAIKKAMQKGALWLQRKGQPQRLRRAKKPLRAGDQLFLYYNAEVLAAEPQAPQLIADEGDYSVWYKPYGMLSQGSKWGDHCAIHRWVELHHQPQKPAFIVHRLDRAATGLILLAHKKSVAAQLVNLFERRWLKKSYRVKVQGDFAKLCLPLTVDRCLDGKKALSHFNCLQSNGLTSLLDVDIESGRKHQIRRHLSGIGFPVVGDRLYGESNTEENLQLTACRLRFQCPVSGLQRDYQLPPHLLPCL